MNDVAASHNFSIETARIEAGTYFHIVRHGRKVCSIWSPQHSSVLAREVVRVLNAHANMDLIDGAIFKGKAPTEAGA